MMVPDHSDDTQEEVYLAAMLYHIGETSFWSTPSDVANLLIKDVQLPPKKFQKKCAQQLGFEFSGLSVGLAKTWNLGEILIKSLDDPDSRTVEMQTISLANQLSEAISSPPESKLEFDNIIKRIGVIMKIDVRLLKERIENTRELALNLLGEYGASVLEHHIKPLPKSSDFMSSTAHSYLASVSKEKALLTTIKQLTAMCRSSQNINDFLTLTLQHSAVNLGLERCTFWVLSADRKLIEARSSFDGAGHAESLKRKVKIDNSVNLISHVVEMDNPIFVDGIKDHKWMSYITLELAKLIGRGVICLLPVKIDEKIVGIVSGQRF
ncbi:MAG: hypothetical protein GY951_06960, partial [Psychromonas sp.]|nr:hypothetical protein [Psychromonas sp.]